MNLKSAPVNILLGVVGLVLLTALGWLALIGPAVGAIGDAGDAHVEAEDRNSAMSVQLAKLRGQAEKLPDTQLLAKQVDTMFPPTADQPGFFAQVKDAADKSGLAAKDITQLDVDVPVFPEEEDAPAAEPADATEKKPAADVSDVAAQLVTISAEGTYDQLTELMSHLEAMDRAYLVASIAIAEGNDEGDTLTMTVIGGTFVAPPLGDPPSGKR